MSINIQNRYISSLFIAVIALFGATACSTTGLEKKENDINIVGVDSKGASIRHAYFIRTDDQLFVRGEVKRHMTGRGPIPGHLHITLIDPQGKVIKEADIGYIRHNVKSSIADFNAKLPVDLAPGSTVQITHFTSDTHKTFPQETEWRSVE